MAKWVDLSGISEVEVTFANGGGCKREKLLMTGGRTQVIPTRTWVSASPWVTVLFFWSGATGQSWLESVLAQRNQ